jgi:hypothetical protein
VAAATFTDQATRKCIKTLKTDNNYSLKGRGPLKLKKKRPAERWEIISYPLIPLLTPLSFRWTVPLNFSFEDIRCSEIFVRHEFVKLSRKKITYNMLSDNGIS